MESGIEEHDMRRIGFGYLRKEGLFNTVASDYFSHVYFRYLKRGFEVCLALALLVLLSPVLAATAVAVKLDSPGPLIFRQKRVGKDGLPFTILKFRSMRDDAEVNGPVWAKVDDERITRVGKWIRKKRIDELPQLINVLAGSMSLIGPRPERPEFVDELKRILPRYTFRHTVRPGITGWAQVNHTYGASVEDAGIKLEYEIYYIEHLSLMLDLHIIFKTIPVMLKGQGAR